MGDVAPLKWVCLWSFFKDEMVEMAVGGMISRQFVGQPKGY